MTTKTQSTPTTPQIRRPQLRLLERLCNAVAVSGDESEVRKIVIDELKTHVDDLVVDNLGNVLITRSGNARNRLKVMIAAHMDEVGFMLTTDEDDGLFRFDFVGGIDVRQIAGKPVIVGSDHVPGVIGLKPIHLLSPDERKQNVSLETLRIDMGPGGSSKAQIGERATFATPFQRTGPSIRAKALDDRIGVASLIELVKHAPTTIDLQAAFTVQEEVGLRGARVAAYHFDPDIAIALDCTPAYDLPTWDGSENVEYNTQLDKGPALYVADSRTLSDPRLIRHFVNTAEIHNIPYQFRQPGGGGTDAGTIHRQREGIPSISISVPGRYLHTAGSICRMSDWRNTLSLVYNAIHSLSKGMLKQPRG